MGEKNSARKDRRIKACFEPVIKGAVVGGTMLVPGVSGGSMAMILGIYSRLITAVSLFFKSKKDSCIFLGLFAAGAFAGMFLFSGYILELIKLYTLPVLYFFTGAVLGGIPLIIKQSGIKKFELKYLFYIAWGIIAVILISMIPQGGETVTDPGFKNFFLLGAAGFAAAVALILPGISVSYVLLVIGLYDETMAAISELYMAFLLPLGAGLVIGIIMTARLLEKAMNTFPRQTYMIILGFVLASLKEVYPGIPHGTDIFVCFITAAAGFLSILMISIRELRG